MIEKNIHQIWVGDKKIPNHIQAYMDKVKSFHQDFTYYLWNDSNLPDLPINLKKIYDSYNEPAIKADLLRMYVVSQFGGYYLDADFDTLDGFYLDNVFKKDSDGIVVYNGSYGMSALANSIFGFIKNNPLLEYLISNITYEQQWIGPNWWAQIVCKYVELDINTASLIDLENKLNQLNIQLGCWKDIEDNCFRHEPLSSWVHGSIWNKKLNSGNYD
jgi:mannosyltransferase OCH1-like enzyme